MKDRSAHPGALNTEDLSRLIGYEQPAALEKWCRENGVRFFRGRRGIWTTMDAVNQALGVSGPGETPKGRVQF
jgi:hypothetical protein